MDETASPFVISPIDLSSWEDVTDIPATEETPGAVKLEARRLDVPGSVDDEPDLLAVALAVEGEGQLWLISGPEAVVAIVPIPDSATDREQVLQFWVATLTAEGAMGLLAAAHGLLDEFTQRDDEGPQFVGLLPLRGISTHQKKNSDDEEWVASLEMAITQAAWEDFELEIDVEMRQIEETDGRVLALQVLTYGADPDLAENQVRQSILTGLKAFTPRRRVEERLVLGLKDEWRQAVAEVEEAESECRS